MFGFRTRGRQKLVVESANSRVRDGRLLREFVSFLHFHGGNAERLRHYFVHSITPKGVGQTRKASTFWMYGYHAQEERKTMFSEFRSCFERGASFCVAKETRYAMLPYCNNVFVFDIDRLRLEVYEFNHHMYGSSNVSVSHPKPKPEDGSMVKGQYLVVEHDMRWLERSWLTLGNPTPADTEREILTKYETNKENLRMLRML